MHLQLHVRQTSFPVCVGHLSFLFELNAHGFYPFFFGVVFFSFICSFFYVARIIVLCYMFCKTQSLFFYFVYGVFCYLPIFFFMVCVIVFFFHTHTHCILFLQEINKLTPSIVNGWPQQKQQWLQLPNMKHTHTMS